MYLSSIWLPDQFWDPVMHDSLNLVNLVIFIQGKLHWKNNVQRSKVNIETFLNLVDNLQWAISCPEFRISFFGDVLRLFKYLFEYNRKKIRINLKIYVLAAQSHNHTHWKLRRNWGNCYPARNKSESECPTEHSLHKPKSYTKLYAWMVSHISETNTVYKQLYK